MCVDMSPRALNDNVFEYGENADMRVDVNVAPMAPAVPMDAVPVYLHIETCMEAQ
jgi:hypothetical protein